MALLFYILLATFLMIKTTKSTTTKPTTKLPNKFQKNDNSVFISTLPKPFIQTIPCNYYYNKKRNNEHVVVPLMKMVIASSNTETKKEEIQSSSSYSSSSSSPIEIMATMAHDWIISNPFDLFNDNTTTTTTTNPTNPNDLNSYIQTKTILAAQVKTFVRVGIPSILASIGCWAIYPFISESLAQNHQTYDTGVLAVLSQDASQYVQNILTTSGLLFTLLVGQTYYFMYQQQEQVFYALFDEVTEAKSLLEQVSLVCMGRGILYQQLLDCISTYVDEDLKILSNKPDEILSSRPDDDPLESIMYLTSVGVPSIVYDTVQSLRRARSDRLGALQRKLPAVHMVLLRLLAIVVLATFPICGSGSQVYGGEAILHVQAIMFGMMAFGLTLVLSVVVELWDPRGGAYNVDSVLSVMIRGLEEELHARMTGELSGFEGAGATSPSPPNRTLLLYATMETPIAADTMITIEKKKKEEDEEQLMMKKSSSRRGLGDWIRNRFGRRRRQW